MATQEPERKRRVQEIYERRRSGLLNSAEFRQLLDGLNAQELEELAALVSEHIRKVLLKHPQV